MTDVRQCPFCELRFSEKWELSMHLDSDHPGRITKKDKYVEVDEPGDTPDPL